MLADPFDLLLRGYGYSPTRKGDNLRYQGEDTFIDLWNSKKGTTVGVYHPQMRKVTYYRSISVDKLEGLLINIEKDVWTKLKK